MGIQLQHERFKLKRRESGRKSISVECKCIRGLSLRCFIPMKEEGGKDWKIGIDVCTYYV